VLFERSRVVSYFIIESSSQTYKDESKRKTKIYSMNLQCLGHQHVHHKDPYSLHNSELQGIHLRLQQTSGQTEHLHPGFHLRNPKTHNTLYLLIEVDIMLNKLCHYFNLGEISLRSQLSSHLTFRHKMPPT
jgi:hypothetical protein